MSRSILGWRKLFGVMRPPSNTVEPPDYGMLRPARITNHYSMDFYA